MRGKKWDEGRDNTTRGVRVVVVLAHIQNRTCSSCGVAPCLVRLKNHGRSVSLSVSLSLLVRCSRHSHRQRGPNKQTNRETQVYNAVLRSIVHDECLSIMQVSHGYDISIICVSCRYQSKSAGFSRPKPRKERTSPAWRRLRTMPLLANHLCSLLLNECWMWNRLTSETMNNNEIWMSQIAFSRLARSGQK